MAVNNLFEIVNIDVPLEIPIKIFLAFVLGGLVGYEREHKNAPAGLRTHILVCIGAALVQITSLNFYTKHMGTFNTDPMRLGAQVISGIGFLGAGTILKEGASVKGLTTAAGIWAVACIGLAVGSGLYIEALVATVFLFIALRSLKKFENKITRQKRCASIRTVVKNVPGKIGEIGNALGTCGIQISSIDMNENEGDNGYITIDLSLEIPANTKDETVMDRLFMINDVKAVNLI